MPAAPQPIAAIITEWRKNSHADVLLSRLLEPEAWGHTRPFALKLVAVYADQFPSNDLCRPYCARHGIPIFPTIEGAVGVGTRGVPVEGVLLIGEHGDYVINARGQTLYPRRRLFEGIIHAFRVLGRRVPVFSDKHLSYEWLFARWMYDLARHEGFPFMAGSSVPVAWRVPEYTLPIGSELTEAFGLGYSDLDSYGFHALEALQCMTERRKGGETGVKAVRCISGAEVWNGLESGLWSRALLDVLLPIAAKAEPSALKRLPRTADVLFRIEYCDGLVANLGMLPSVSQSFGFACRRQGSPEADALIFDLEVGRPYGHFGHLLRAVEAMILSGQSSYPVERTLLTSGMLSALLQSHAEGGTTIPTPHLAEVRYQPVDWPFAKGTVGTPA